MKLLELRICSGTAHSSKLSPWQERNTRVVQHFSICREETLAAEQLAYCVTSLITPALDYEAHGQVSTEIWGEKIGCRTHWPKEQQSAEMY